MMTSTPVVKNVARAVALYAADVLANGTEQIVADAWAAGEIFDITFEVIENAPQLFPELFDGEESDVDEVGEHVVPVIEAHVAAMIAGWVELGVVIK